MNVLGSIGVGQCLPNAVVADVGELAQAIEQTECLQDAGIDSAMISK